MTTTDKPRAQRQAIADGLVQWFGAVQDIRVTMIRHEKPGQPEEQWFVRPLHGANFVGAELVDADGNIGVSQVQVFGSVSSGDEFAEEKAAATAVITEAMGESADGPQVAAKIAAALVDAGWRPEAETYDYDPDYSLSDLDDTP